VIQDNIDAAISGAKLPNDFTLINNGNQKLSFLSFLIQYYLLYGTEETTIPSL
jgi:hypothetical protein